MMIARIIVGSGKGRRVFQVEPQKDARRNVARDIKRFLFPTDGAFHKARRRGERALAGA